MGLGFLLPTVARDPLALNKAIAALGAYSLIRRDVTNKTLSVHRLVQAVLKDTMDASMYQVWAHRVVMLVLIGEDPVATKNVAPGELLGRVLAKVLLDVGKLCIDVIVPGLLHPLL